MYIEENMAESIVAQLQSSDVEIEAAELKFTKERLNAILAKRWAFNT